MRLRIDDIKVGGRIRPLRQAIVDDLASSIQSIGLQTPISVCSGVEKSPTGIGDGIRFDLIAGHHRLAACKQLGWEDIEANVVSLSPDEARLWEIDENLCRADLTELERGEHLIARKEVYDRLYPDATAGAHRAAAMHRALGHDVGQQICRPTFAQATSEALHVHKETIGRQMRRVNNIDSKVRDRIRGIPEVADSGAELQALAAMEPKDQRRAVAFIESGEARGIRDAKKIMKSETTAAPRLKSDEERSRKWRESFIKLVNTALPADLEWAREHLDRPVADDTTALRVVGSQ